MTAVKKKAAPKVANDDDAWNLRLYVAGQSAKCVAAVRNLNALLRGAPGRALPHRGDRSAGEPASWRATTRSWRSRRWCARLPEPLRKIVGDLSNTERMLVGFDLRPPSSVADRFGERDGRARTRRSAGDRPRDPPGRGRRVRRQEAAEERIYSLRSADLLYRAMIEEMKDGAVALRRVRPGCLLQRLLRPAGEGRPDRDRRCQDLSVLPVTSGTSSRPCGSSARRRRPAAASWRSARRTERLVPVLAAMNRIRARCADRAVLPDRHGSDRAEASGSADASRAGGRTSSWPCWPTSCATRSRRSATPPSGCAGRPTATRAGCGGRATIIDRQVDQLTRLVDDLLDVSRITRGKISLNVQALELEDVVARAVEAVRPMIDARRQELRISPAGNAAARERRSRPGWRR